MPVRRTTRSPVGSTASEAAARRAARSAVYRQQRDARADLREIAWLIIKYRMDHGFTQEELADRVGTSHSQISRIESGRHATSVDTLLRIARALDLKLVIGFESTRGSRKKRDVVAL
jgi:ribosome-binding protein aMBF1 (putative translation factor)